MYTYSVYLGILELTNRIIGSTFSFLFNQYFYKFLNKMDNSVIRKLLSAFRAVMQGSWVSTGLWEGTLCIPDQDP